MPSYDALKSKQTELIRKALDGSAFVADVTADPIANLTTATGTEPNVVIDLTELPTGYTDLGFLTEDGVGFSRDVSTSEVTSWGSVAPTRTDLISDSTTVSVTAQETNIMTIGLATGKEMTTVTPAAGTGEVQIAKPARPSSRFYRLLTIAVDQGDAGEIYIARFFPRAKVTGFGDQSFSGGDAPVEWPVTFQAYEDSDLGYSEKWYFGGAGWDALLVSMGFPASA